MHSADVQPMSNYLVHEMPCQCMFSLSRCILWSLCLEQSKADAQGSCGLDLYEQMGLHAPTSFTENILIQNLDINLKWCMLKQHAYPLQIILKKYHCTIDLLFDWFGLVCFANKKNCQSLYSLLQTSQTGVQWYSDTSPFSFPCPLLKIVLGQTKNSFFQR